MTITELMTPAEDAVHCYPSTTIREALKVILANPDKGAIVVVDDDNSLHSPVGIVTKTDLLKGYEIEQGLDTPVEIIMGRSIETIPVDATKDKAAEHFEKTKHYNAFVVDKDNKWVGLLTVLDVAMDRAKDARAWPWNRESGALDYLTRRVHSPHTSKKVHKNVEAPDVDNYEDKHTFLQIAGANE